MTKLEESSCKVLKMYENSLEWRALGKKVPNRCHITLYVHEYSL